MELKIDINTKETSVVKQPKKSVKYMKLIKNTLGAIGKKA